MPLSAEELAARVEAPEFDSANYSSPVSSCHGAARQGSDPAVSHLSSKKMNWIEPKHNAVLCIGKSFKEQRRTGRPAAKPTKV